MLTMEVEFTSKLTNGPKSFSNVKMNGTVNEAVFFPNCVAYTFGTISPNNNKIKVIKIE